jgi:DNA-binding NarL/FixJ family response regulator
MAIRVLLADDHALVRQGLRRLLETEPEISVVGEASTGVEAEAMATSLAPDVILMDLQMPEKNGVEAIEGITAAHPGIGVVVLTMHDADEHLRAALQAGARGYLLKTATAREVVNAVQAVHEGKSLLDPEMTTRMLAQFRRMNKNEEEDAPTLSEKELAVLRLLAAGQSNKQIARSLKYSESTVKNRLSVIFEKLEVQDRTQAVIRGVKLGLLKLDTEQAERHIPRL